MPISLSPDFNNFANGIAGGLGAVAGDVLFSSIVGVFNDTIRPALGWGEDHTIEYETTDEFGNTVTVHFTVSAPHLRDRPAENTQLSKVVLPGLFQSATNRIASDVANGISRVVGMIGAPLRGFFE